MSNSKLTLAEALIKAEVNEHDRAEIMAFAEYLRTGGVEAEVDLSSCPYYQGTGICESGCTTEPSCMTDEPLEGWPSRRNSNGA